MELFVYRNENRKRKQPSWRRRIIIGGSTTAAIVVAALVYARGQEVARTIVAAQRFVLDNPYFSVREIQIRGGDKVGGTQILAMAGLKHGMNMWRIEPAIIESRVQKHPWIRRVLVRREFPHRVVIEIEERMPKAIVAMGTLYYVDGDGVIFKPVGSGEQVSFPILTGLRPEELTKSAPNTRRRIQDALRLADLLDKDARTVSEIHFGPADRVVLYTTAFRVALHIGSGDWSGKLERLNRVLTLWKGHEQRLAALDVSFGDQVVARLRQTKY